MPSVNITTFHEESVRQFERHFSGLAEIIANTLSCPERRLESRDIRMNVLVSHASYNSSQTKIEMYAQRYDNRVTRADDICQEVQAYVMQHCPAAGSVDAYLYLADVGYAVVAKSSREKKTSS